MHRGLQVETHWPEIRHRRHSSDGTHHLALDVFKGFALCLGHIEDDEEETHDTHGSEEPEGTVISNSGCKQNEIVKAFVV